eukprot:Polyplicarium_translucidae@DN3382_c0_g2_i1.p1
MHRCLTPEYFPLPPLPILQRPLHSLVTWDMVFLFQLIFCLYGFTPAAKRSDVVQRGVSMWYIVSILGNIVWIYLVKQTRFQAACVVTDLQWFALAIAQLGVYRQLHNEQRRPARHVVPDYIFCSVPISVSFAQASAAATLGDNITLAKYFPDSMSVQFAAAILSLVFVAMLGLFFFLIAYPDPVVPAALILPLVLRAIALRKPESVPVWVTDVEREALR